MTDTTTGDASSRLEAGDQAPDFTLTDSAGQPVELSAYRRQDVVVYFYPAAMTPGCTKEACHFRDLAAEFAAVGATRVGISADPVHKQASPLPYHAEDIMACWRRIMAPVLWVEAADTNMWLWLGVAMEGVALMGAISDKATTL